MKTLGAVGTKYPGMKGGFSNVQVRLLNSMFCTYGTKLFRTLYATNISSLAGLCEIENPIIG